MRVVWILGAGASVGLGGPTLESLLTNKGYTDLRARYGEEEFPRLHDPASHQMRFLYRVGRPRADAPGADVLWQHAEQFLDYLDTAADNLDGPFARRLELTLKENGEPETSDTVVDDLRAAARRSVAAECCAFLEDADIRSEKWAPYVRWSHSLGADDTVITFNYDRVLECTEPPKATVVIDEDSFRRAAEFGHCRIFKLHGSVDWKKTLDDTVVPTRDPRFALTCKDGELALATPGPTKANHAELRPLGALWNHAMRAIGEADRVVFVGYRFPPTDAISRERIIEALSGTSTSLECHVVLGQSTRDEQRIQGLLLFAMRARKYPPGTIGIPPRSQINIQPLFAEDFFAVMKRELL